MGDVRAIHAEVRSMLDEGRRLALATVVRAWGSAPRRPGAAMVVAADGHVAGSVSGGCVEAAVIAAAAEVLAGQPARELVFAVSDDDALAVGLACGGSITVWVDRLEDEPAVRRWLDGLAADVPVAVATLLDGPDAGRRLVLAGDVAPDDADDLLSAAAREGLSRGESAAIEAGGRRAFVAAWMPRDHLVVVGAGHLARALVPAARAVGFRVTVVDPRSALATRERFPTADRLVARWPDAATLADLGLDATTYVAVLSHDDKIDDPAVAAALAAGARYVGALGSRRTHERRLARLAASGVPGSQAARVRGPIGLDIGAVEPDEIAVAVTAELVAARRGRLDGSSGAGSGSPATGSGASRHA